MRRGLPKIYLNLAQVEQRLGLARGALSRVELPMPDVIVGPLEPRGPRGQLPRGTVRGWLPATIDAWARYRPGQGARTDLRKKPCT